MTIEFMESVQIKIVFEELFSLFPEQHNVTVNLIDDESRFIRCSSTLFTVHVVFSKPIQLCDLPRIEASTSKPIVRARPQGLWETPVSGKKVKVSLALPNGQPDRRQTIRFGTHVGQAVNAVVVSPVMETDELAKQVASASRHLIRAGGLPGLP